MDLTLVIALAVVIPTVALTIVGVLIWLCRSRKTASTSTAAPQPKTVETVQQQPKPTMSETATDCDNHTLENEAENTQTMCATMEQERLQESIQQEPAIVQRAVDGPVSLKAPSHSAPPNGQSEMVQLKAELKQLYKKRQDSIEVSSSGYVFKDINVSPAIRLKKAICAAAERANTQKSSPSFLSMIGLSSR
uniref:Uncharacterized protein n=1 Tax=Chromera velia CCMP2878 TaxID=1169474 RepID=A0A0G4HMT7_9ALVE|mmetsp:Transcript_44530/g.87991  ORF Transcript_44530/g.87991 Transcript_44530/m.87991 type:complete len:192 (-) Transcript_44530:986-1561(-)|eukprot:Cvel_29304.t1-p1 / transcript=Cvel_29304.t1 / gene=Cvel_29304 / organism=Chromera_velia_CCMP2878 / gene_product=hypothetical protein / transcript_product=hypothetical protein / location=Cvel_scaffold3985:9949-10521(+) / protein_length=191 / sequence_SO=supercontig / SO=protein_coding / is_pseudo=false